MKSLDRIRHSDWTHYWPVFLIGAFCLMCWLHQQRQRAMEKSRTLERLLADYTFSTEEQAAEAFSTGNFQRAAALLSPIAACPNARPSTQLLQARTLECLGRFLEAAQIYSGVEAEPAMSAAILRAKRFTQRMATERRSIHPGSREQFYRLHAELMERGDATTARLIARKLLPDTEPMRNSTIALLQQWDSGVQLTTSTEPGRLDVTIRHLDPKTLALLRDMKIGTLSVSRSGLDATRILATLDVQALDLSYNGFSDLAGVRALPLRRLEVNDTRTADLRPLAGMPLREVNLARTMISALSPLSLCPLEKLNVASTAVRTLESLRGLELKELDLSHTRVTDLSPLVGMPLERLILTGTDVHDLKPLAGARLKSLSLAGTPVKDISVLASMPLVELDLRGCELLADLDSITTCPQLERVFVPRHIKVPENHWGLPQLKVVQAGRRTTVAQQ